MVNPLTVDNFAFLFYCTPVGDFRLCDSSDLMTYVLMGLDALAVCQTHMSLPVRFLLFWHSVSFTVESLSLLYLLFIS